jgi:hypothetical protein
MSIFQDIRYARLTPGRSSPLQLSLSLLGLQHAFLQPAKPRK